MGKRELQIKENGGKLGLSGKKCVHMNCLMLQGKKYGTVNLLFNPLNSRAELFLPACQCLGSQPLWGGELASPCPLLSEMGCNDFDTAPV